MELKESNPRFESPFCFSLPTPTHIRTRSTNITMPPHPAFERPSRSDGGGFRLGSDMARGRDHGQKYAYTRTGELEVDRREREGGILRRRPPSTDLRLMAIPAGENEHIEKVGGDADTDRDATEVGEGQHIVSLTSTHRQRQSARATSPPSAFGYRDRGARFSFLPQNTTGNFPSISSSTFPYKVGGRDMTGPAERGDDQRRPVHTSSESGQHCFSLCCSCPPFFFFFFSASLYLTLPHRCTASTTSHMSPLPPSQYASPFRSSVLVTSTKSSKVFGIQTGGIGNTIYTHTQPRTIPGTSGRHGPSTIQVGQTSQPQTFGMARE